MNKNKNEKPPQHDFLQKIAAGLDDLLKVYHGGRVGFALFVCEIESSDPDQKCNYVDNPNNPNTIH